MSCPAWGSFSLAFVFSGDPHDTRQETTRLATSELLVIKQLNRQEDWNCVTVIRLDVRVFAM